MIRTLPLLLCACAPHGLAGLPDVAGHDPAFRSAERAFFGDPLGARGGSPLADLELRAGNGIRVDQGAMFAVGLEQGWRVDRATLRLRGLAEHSRYRLPDGARPLVEPIDIRFRTLAGEAELLFGRRACAGLGIRAERVATAITSPVLDINHISHHAHGYGILEAGLGPLRARLRLGGMRRIGAELRWPMQPRAC